MINDTVLFWIFVSVGIVAGVVGFAVLLENMVIGT